VNRILSVVNEGLVACRKVQRKTKSAPEMALLVASDCSFDKMVETGHSALIADNEESS